MASLFEQQAGQLLIEIGQIINEKWPLEVNNGHKYLRTIIDSYRAIFEIKTDEFNEREFYLKQLPHLNNCNLLHTRLRESIVNLEALVTRLVAIEKNVNYLIGMKVDLFAGNADWVNMNEFKRDLEQVLEGFRCELRLKTEIVDRLLFRSRTDEASQIAIMSMWIHEPYLNDLLVAKLTTSIKFYSNNNKL